jgi:SHS2 domain-containing protein
VGEWKVTLWAPSLAGLFVECARIVAREGGRAAGSPGTWLPVRVSARDAATLLVDWANELIGRSEHAHRAFRDVRVRSVTARRIVAQVRGPRVAHWRSALKAATYHGARVTCSNDRWEAELLFDV